MSITYRVTCALNVVLATVLVVLGTAASASAHGDPASHYLEAGSLYPAFGNRPSQALELQLLGLLDASASSGYPIKVALVANADDLTDNPGMLKTPQRYAEFVGFTLARERAPVLVVTPYGFGVSGRELRDGTLRLVSRVRARALVGGAKTPPEQGDALARAAMTTVRRIARAGGHALPAHVPPAQPIAAGPGLDTAAGDDGGGGIGGWLPLTVGGLVFLFAWLGFEVWTRIARGRLRHAPRAD